MKLPRMFTAICNPKPKAIVIACGDPRFQDSVEELREFLKLPNGTYVPIGNGGGPVPLAHPTTMPDRCRGMIRQIRFYRKIFPSIERAVLLTHGNCGYYITAPCQCRGEDKERRDVALAASVVKLVAPELHVEPYYAELAAGEHWIDIYKEGVSRELPAMPAPAEWAEWIREYEPATLA